MVLKVIYGYDYVDNDNIFDDGNGYGIYCVGIIGVFMNNSVGIVGVVL